MKTGTMGMKWMAAAMLAVLQAGAAYATEGVVVGDAYVNSAHPAVNYGNLSNLYVNSTGTALLQFDLSALPAGTTASQIGAASQQFIVIDITSLVQEWVTTPSSNFGVALTTSSGDLVLDSKENDETSHAAHLDITVVSQGPAGPQGPQGAAGVAGAAGLNGTAATISVGTTTTGAAGSSASVTNSGSSSAAVLNFTIPQGATGPAGPAAPTTIPFVCNNNCSEFGVEVIVPTAFPQFNNAAFPPYTGGYAHVNDAPMGTAHGVIGIATGPDQGVIGGNGIVSQQFYTAGQTVQVATSGIAFCQFDSQVVAGDYVTASPNNQGYCNSIGSNYALAASGSSGQLIGIALAENGLDDFGYFAAVPVLLNAEGAVR